MPTGAEFVTDAADTRSLEFLLRPALVSRRFQPMTESIQRRYAVIMPACDEEPCIAAVLAEMRVVADPGRFVIAVGVNDSRDGTADIARAH